MLACLRMACGETAAAVATFEAAATHWAAQTKAARSAGATKRAKVARLGLLRCGAEFMLEHKQWKEAASLAATLLGSPSLSSSAKKNAQALQLMAL